MSLSSHCDFCNRLPVTHKRKAGKAAHCPVCMGELIVAWRTGDRYRLVAGGERGTARWWLATASIGLAVLTIGLAAMALRPAAAPQPQHLAKAPEPIHSPMATAPDAQPVVTNGQIAQAVPVTEKVPEGVKPAPTEDERVAKSKRGPDGLEAAGAAGNPFAKETAKPKAVAQTLQRKSQNELQVLLASVPEIALDEKREAEPKTKEEIQQATMRIKERVKKIAEQTKNDPDAFVKQLIALRPDLRGVQWRQGKDCQLSKESAEHLQKTSACVRSALDVMKGIDLEARKRTTIPAENYDRIDAFWANFEHSMVLPELQALHQMVMVEGPSFRRSLVSHMGANVKMGASAVILAQRAVFDLDPDVRTLAIEALSHHKTENYLPTLLDALHHPWAPAAAHAAEALAALKPHEALPQLVEMLAQPDPTAPFTKRVDGKQVKVVRELVAVNHLRNCLLCHAPSTSQKDIIRGPLPTPGVPIPTSSAVYYAERNAAALIRADITYLKQDFSVMQPVKDHGVWPEQQRFDYLVRVRPLTAAENAAFKRQQRAKKTPPLSEHKQVILYTLRELTGQDAGTSVAEWRKVIAAIKK